MGKKIIRINETQLTKLIYESVKKISNMLDIPEDSGLNVDNIQQYAGVPQYNSYCYFGDCKNTVVKDHMWDASQMGQWIYNNCKVVDINMVLDKLQDGDRPIPTIFNNTIQKLKKENRLNNLKDIICAMDDYQKIMFIYITSLDTHYFFDCKNN